ncbi:hypothetical protein M3M39_05025 [Fructilactobacillus hinvesii]|uniref:Uncharacterized protein n=1 Tax=Fructilactobacillus hinvesii TaxID=2940300 RepID=A0ABY5BU11_9LACO|nr:hypothetical protein [Fructilactobacillus hinvesii]USS87486.1 hypothetical protein M3M39_05025 [Fructilactobacillus hinvesii]
METIKQHNDRMARIIVGYSFGLKIYLNMDNLSGFKKKVIKIVSSMPDDDPVAEVVQEIKQVFNQYFDNEVPETIDGCKALLEMIDNICHEKIMELTGSLV